MEDNFKKETIIVFILAIIMLLSALTNGVVEYRYGVTDQQIEHLQEQINDLEEKVEGG